MTEYVRNEYRKKTHNRRLQSRRKEQEKREKALARSMANTKQVKAANVLNNAFSSSAAGGDGKELCATDHPIVAGTDRNELSTAADLNETSLEQSLIDIAAFTDERGLKIAAQGVKMIIPSALQFTAERLMKSAGRT